jgi:hypothetical protein
LRIVIEGDVLTLGYRALRFIEADEQTIIAGPLHPTLLILLSIPNLGLAAQW